MAALSTSAEAAHAMRALARLTPRGAKLVIAPALDAACGLGYDPAAIDRLVALDVAEHTELWQAGPLAHKPPPRLDHNAAAHLIVGTAVLLRGALRSATPARFLERALREEAHLPDAVVPLVMKAVDRARQRVERASLAQLSGAPVLGAPRGGDRARAPLGAFLPSYAGVRWRIDVVISSSALQRVLRPHLHMEVRARACGAARPRAARWRPAAPRAAHHMPIPLALAPLRPPLDSWRCSTTWRATAPHRWLQTRAPHACTPSTARWARLRS